MADEYTDAEKLTAIEQMRNSINPAVKALVERNLEAVRAFENIAVIAKQIMERKERS